MLGRANILLLATMALGAEAAMAQDTKPAVPPKGQERAVPINEPWLFEADDLIGAKIKEGTDDIGEIENFVFDSVSGECRFAVIGLGGVLGVGEQKSLVPIEVLQLQRDPDGKDEWYRFTSDRAKLTSAPKMPEDFSAPANEGWEARNLEHYGVKRNIPPSTAGTPSFLLQAKQIKDMNLHGMDGKKVGEIEQLYLDAASHRIAAFVLGAGGVPGLGEKDYILPWGVVKVARDDDGKAQLRTTVTTDLLSRAPAFEEKMLPDREWMNRVYTHYSARPFWTGAQEAGYEKKPDGTRDGGSTGGQ